MNDKIYTCHETQFTVSPLETYSICYMKFPRAEKLYKYLLIQHGLLIYI